MATVGKKALALVIAFLTSWSATPASAQSAAPPLQLDTSFNLGPIAAALRITKPFAQPSGGVMSTIHMEARDDTQTPAFHATLNGIGKAADPETLLGGLAPAVIIVKHDLLGGMTFADAVADAQAKTGVTVTSLEDASMVEYALLLVAVLLLAAAGSAGLSPTLHDDLVGISSRLTVGLAAAGGPTLCGPGVPVLVP